MITVESITKKIGFNPFEHEMVEGVDYGGDDSAAWSALDALSNEELNFIMDGFRERKKQRSLEMPMKV